MENCVASREIIGATGSCGHNFGTLSNIFVFSNYQQRRIFQPLPSPANGERGHFCRSVRAMGETCFERQTGGKPTAWNVARERLTHVP
jgi:hypothetical protein